MSDDIIERLHRYSESPHVTPAGIAVADLAIREINRLRAALASKSAPGIDKTAERVECARIELVVAIHTLASHFENALYKFRDDAEALRKAKGDIAHAMKIAAKHNQNGPGCAAPQQRKPRPEAAGFDHALGAGRFTVVKGAFWWHIRIGDSTNNVGKFHSKMAAENMALKLLTAFRDGAYTQYMISLSQQRQPLTDERIRQIVLTQRREWTTYPEPIGFARAVEAAHGIGGKE